MSTVRELEGLIKIGGRVTRDEPMDRHSSFRIGGPADLYVVPSRADEAGAVLRLCAERSVPCFVLGGGTNILVADRGIRGVVMDVTGLSGIEFDGARVAALAGTLVSDLAEAALARRLSGLEFAYALPGTVGGAVWMNARCYEREVSDVLAFVDHVDGEAIVRRRPLDRAEWAYKLSPYQAMGGAILGAGFTLAEGDPAEMERQMKDHRADRERKGHFLYPCAGSIFKNNRAFGAPTGKIVDSLGLKGTRVGGAQVAPFHGNIIVNTGGATGAEVRALIERVEEEVSRRLGFALEREVVLVGDW